MNIFNVNIFHKILHFYPTLKNGGPKHDFFVLMNVPAGVHERVKNLLTRIGIRDLTICDRFLLIFRFARKFPFLENVRNPGSVKKLKMMYYESIKGFQNPVLIIKCLDFTQRKINPLFWKQHLTHLWWEKSCYQFVKSHILIIYIRILPRAHHHFSSRCLFWMNNQKQTMWRKMQTNFYSRNA